jgi:N-acylglucosamine 2-epimerase
MATQPTNLTILTPQRIDELIKVYRDGLLHDVLPFWINHCVDREYGGFMFALDRDGTVIDTDKPIWIHGRFTWLLSTLYNTVEKRAEWLELAQHGIDFLRRYGFDSDGRMFFQVTREGKPLRKRRYIFSETFATIALAAYGKASGDERTIQEALDLFKLIIRYLTTPGLLPPKIIPETRQSKGLAIPMIMIVTAQVLRESLADPTFCNEWIDRWINEIERDFMKPEFQAVLETVGPNGEFIDHFDGRMLCPGHAIEAAWFIMREAQYRGNNPRLLKLGTTILDWMWHWGWDEEYGGIIYYRDVKGLPVQEYWQDMKFWWPQNEVIVAALMAYQLASDEKYIHWHQLAHDWAYQHFPDPEYGEWYGYLHRDGRISTRLKGNMWKGPFHLPRMQLVCWQILEQIRSQ